MAASAKMNSNKRIKEGSVDDMAEDALIGAIMGRIDEMEGEGADFSEIVSAVSNEFEIDEQTIREILQSNGHEIDDTEGNSGFEDAHMAIHGESTRAAGKRIKEFYFQDTCPKCDAPMKNNKCPECGFEGDTQTAGPEDEHFSKVQELQSAILKAKGQSLLDETRAMWEAEHLEEEYQEGTLDFKNIKENYQRKPPTPEVFTKNDEDKIYKKIIEKTGKPAGQKLQEADMLISPYAKHDVGDMSGWRDLVEDHNIDEDINERLGAAAVATALLSEANEGAIATGLKRMKELVTPEVERGADAGDIATLLSRGGFNEADLNEKSDLARVREAMNESAAGGEDLAALVMGDTRDLG
jgi:hypothetical protein